MADAPVHGTRDAAALARRHPLPALLLATGFGWMAYAVSRDPLGVPARPPVEPEPEEPAAAHRQAEVPPVGRGSSASPAPPRQRASAVPAARGWRAGLDVLKATVKDWSEDEAPRLAASLAYYTIFSLAPLLMIAIALAAFVFGDEAARGQIFGELKGLVGPDGAAAIEDMLANARQPGRGVLASLVGLATLFLGASGVMNELQAAMNRIWEVQPRPDRGWKGLLQDRIFSFTMVLGVGFLLLVSLLMSAALAALGGHLQGLLPASEALLQALNVALSLAIISVLFMLIFKYVPDIEIAWRDVWPGAAATAALFTLGKLGIGFYLGRGSFASSYGAAGSLVVLVVWVYYSAQILFLGAEMTQVLAARRGAHVVPRQNAVAVGTATAPAFGQAAKAWSGPERRLHERRRPEAAFA